MLNHYKKMNLAHIVSPSPRAFTPLYRCPLNTVLSDETSLLADPDMPLAKNF